MDYTCERGAKRNFEVWRNTDPDANKLETEDERLDRLEAERAEAGGAMEELEMKVHDAKREMEIADALDEIRTRNARISRAEGREAEDDALEAADRKRREIEDEKRRVEEEDAETARRAFARGSGGIEIEEETATITPESVRFNGNSSVSYDGFIATKDEDETFPAMSKEISGNMAPPPKPQPQPQPVPEFKRTKKPKKDFSAALGIKKKPALV